MVEMDEPLEDMHQQERDLLVVIKRVAEITHLKEVLKPPLMQKLVVLQQRFKVQNHLINIHQKLCQKHATPTNLELLSEALGMCVRSPGDQRG